MLERCLIKSTNITNHKRADRMYSEPTGGLMMIALHGETGLSISPTVFVHYSRTDFSSISVIVSF